MSLPAADREIWTDMYKLHEKFNDMGNDVDDWVLWWKTAVSIIHKHNDSKLAEELVLAITGYLESERKVKNECGETAEQNSPDTQSESNPSSQLAMF